MTKGKQIRLLLSTPIYIALYFIIKSQRFKIDRNPYIMALILVLFIGHIWYEGIYKKKKIDNKKADIKSKHLAELKNRQNDFITEIADNDLPNELKSFVSIFNKWGIDNKILKNDLYKNVTKNQLYELKSIEEKREFIENWIENNSEKTDIIKTLQMTIASYDELGLWTWDKKN